MNTSNISSLIQGLFREAAEGFFYDGMEAIFMKEVNRAKEDVLNGLKTLRIEKNTILVDEASIHDIRNTVVSLSKAANCGASSISREKAVFICYKFLSLCKWSGSEMAIVPFEDWGPLVYLMNEDQLAYYLFWREKARNGVFKECTNAQIWLYTYDLILNTCFQNPDDTIVALLRINENYDRLVSSTIRKKLTKQYHDQIIGEYCLYNMRNDLYETLPYEYRIRDDYPRQTNIAEGHYKNTGSYLANLYYRTSRLCRIDLQIEPFLPAILEEVFQRISPFFHDAQHAFAQELIGSLSKKTVWQPYADTIFYGSIIAKSSAASHQSFSIEGHEYIYTVCEEQPGKTGSVYDSSKTDIRGVTDPGGEYYYYHYSGCTETGRLFITFIVNRIRSEYRERIGKKALSDVRYPFQNYESDIKKTIRSVVRAFNFEANISENRIKAPVVLLSRIDVVKRKTSIKSNSISAQQKRETDFSDRDTQRIAWITVISRKGRKMNADDRAKKLWDTFNTVKSSATKKDTAPLEKIASSTVVPMLSIDTEKAIAMWEWLLKHYSFLKDDYAYTYITKDIVRGANAHAVICVIESSEYICSSIFAIRGDTGFGCLYDFFVELILEEKYSLFDTIMQLITESCTNDRMRAEELYSILSVIIESSKIRWFANRDGVSAVQKWVQRITIEGKRSILMLGIEELFDILDGTAPRGGVTTDMLELPSVKEELLTGNHRRTIIQSNEKKPKVPPQMEALESNEMSGLTNTSQSNAVPNEQFQTNTVLLEEGLSELNRLIGLDRVKEDVQNLINIVHVQRIRKQRGMKTVPLSLHLVFSGNPGTGKTTVARILGKIYCALGVLKKGHLVEVDRSGLVAGYVGQTALKTQEVITQAIGGILFIDEAYSLVVEGTDNDFGREAIDTLLKAMEDNRDNLIIVVAGYSNLMKKFIESNPGLKSRFNKYIEFRDYTDEELVEIFLNFSRANDYEITEDALATLRQRLFVLHQNRGENFGNARTIRNIFERVVSIQANRIIQMKTMSDADVQTITIEDISNEDIWNKPNLFQ